MIIVLINIAGATANLVGYVSGLDKWEQITLILVCGFLATLLTILTFIVTEKQIQTDRVFEDIDNLLKEGISNPKQAVYEILRIRFKPKHLKRLLKSGRLEKYKWVFENESDRTTE